MHPSGNRPFHEILSRVVQGRTQTLKVSTRSLAERLGPDYRSLMHWLAGDRWFPAELLPQLCVELQDFTLLDELEHQVGRVAYHVPQHEQVPNMEDFKAVQRLVKEVGEALEILAATFEDGIVEKHEVDATLPALDDVIRECARLKHWIKQRHHSDFPPKRHSAV